MNEETNSILEKTVQEIRYVDPEGDGQENPLEQSEDERDFESLLLHPNFEEIFERQRHRFDDLARKVRFIQHVRRADHVFFGASYLWVLARRNHLDGFKALIELGADVNFRCLNVGGAVRREAPIHTCARFNHVELLRYILSLPQTRVQRFKDDGATAIFLAMQEGQVEAAKLLLAAGADPNRRRYDLTPPFNMLVQGERLELLEYFRDHVPKKPATVCMYEGDPQDLRLTPEQLWVDINIFDGNGGRPVFQAVSHEKMLDSVLQFETLDLSVCSRFDYTAFELSFLVHHPECALKIVKRYRPQDVRTKSLRILNRLFVHNQKLGWSDEDMAIVTQCFEHLMNHCNVNPFTAFQPSLFESGPENKFWKMVNRWKVWSWKRHIHLMFPEDFQKVAVELLLCFKAIAPTLSYPMPKMIIFEILTQLSSLTYANTFPNESETSKEQPEMRFRLDLFSDELRKLNLTLPDPDSEDEDLDEDDGEENDNNDDNEE